ncbi:hypothetical protein CARUB_v10014661mg [Capsella rubella]|uniref:Uncharacterized protein n=1 Tax=Capsella rubella TaxID=81985 RepID=R0I0V0_9BRAS|nr:uncharacterized protein LOC17890919 [Capsella rubella]EOA31475.1 hypothetical protein CARUB_v10014661mg [Capsella rubella]
MNPEQNRRECAVCSEAEPSFIHTISKTGVLRRLCTDCLLKEHRELFCPVCFNDFNDDAPSPRQARITCLNCPLSTHLFCSPKPPSSSAASSSSPAPPPASSFTCPPCSDPNFTFFPKSRVNDDVPATPLSKVSTLALVAAAKISVANMNNAVAQLKDEAFKKIVTAHTAKLKAKAALENLQDLVIRQKTQETMTPSKRKSDDR